LGNRKWHARRSPTDLFKIKWLQLGAKGFTILFGFVFSGFVWLVCHEIGVIAQQALQRTIWLSCTQGQRCEGKMRCWADLSASALCVV
jgi:hypothetical protein